MEKLIKKFTNLINRFGNSGRLYTFDICSDYGVELEGSTIDSIVIDGNTIIFFYNENTGDYDDITIFKEESLKQFYNEISSALNE